MESQGENELELSLSRPPSSSYFRHVHTLNFNTRVYDFTLPVIIYYGSTLNLKYVFHVS